MMLPFKDDESDTIKKRRSTVSHMLCGCVAPPSIVITPRNAQEIVYCLRVLEA